MKTFYQLATFILMMTVLAVTASAQALGPETTLANLTEGQGAIGSNSNPQWDGLSELVLIPGAALIGASSTSTSLYLGFTGGSEADIGNMVVYEVPRNSSTVLKVEKVTLGGTQSPSSNAACVRFWIVTTPTAARPSKNGSVKKKLPGGNSIASISVA